ncbi:hypothetical protein BCR44DRAFT_40073 [Catenaria anguillulae PL171]|uniref:Uncharacterized protein n=1 Tax=Catenaria anguillulae PL171 TaxID=765915 RepID=A0A1Y2H7J3_9FUNG|nr:hypothetical protein BCR44DRAFT_40073 [Catenaria anguillulae PL171]
MTTSPTDQSGPDASESAGDSVSSLLPAELLLSVLSLCCPISRLPSTCRALSASLSPGSQPQRIWFQHLAQQVIFRNPEHNPKVVNWCYSPELPHHSNNERYPSIAQIESPMSYYLKASIPADGRSIFRGGCASGLAPEPGSQLPATIFTKDFVQVLFSSAGPFAKFQRHNVETDLVAMLERIRPDEIFDDDGSGQPAFARTWHLIPDAFLLATFFIRTSQLDLLHVTLTHLRSLFPTLGAASAPFQIWSRLMLDNRTSVLAWLSNITAHSDLSMTYPTFLCSIGRYLPFKSFHACLPTRATHQP